MGIKVSKCNLSLNLFQRFCNRICKLFLLFFAFLLCNIVFADDVVRVGLTDNKFQNVLKQEVTVYGTSDCEICDKETRKIIAAAPAESEILIRNGISGLDIYVDGKWATLRDFVIICPRGVLGVKDLKRKSMPALYHGAFEVVRHSEGKGFYLINLIEIQEYLKGVVPNEMPVKFGLEALKAQAVAARNYVLTPRTQAYKEFNVVDSVASQVYYGVNTEDDLATRAVMETDGIVALYNNEPILALYSSTAGGYTESYANAFSDPLTKMFPSLDRPYLSAVPDKSEFEPLNEEEKAKEFYESKIPSFDIESPYYRWQKEWTASELENVLKTTLIAQSKTGFIHPAFKQGDDLGHIKDIKVMRRGTSGKAIEVELMTNKNCYRISKELVIRRVFQKNGISLPSANILFENKKNNEGNITDIIIKGGGFGHGVGMSQYGAGYMSTKLRQPYYNILRHYYTGINLGTMPITIFGEEVKQTFWAPIGRAQIVITNSTAPKIAVMINGKELELPVTKTIFQKDFRIDISRYIEDGANTIVFYPPTLGRTVTLYVELVEKYGRIDEEK